jgi:uncharacterized membrane protein YczE
MPQTCPVRYPPLPARLPRRLVHLFAGLAAYAVSMALLVRSSLGNMPWDVLHQGLAQKLHLSLGTLTVIVGALVLLAWVPLRQRPGFGTVCNVVVIGVVVDAALAVLPTPSGLAVRIAFAVVGIGLNAVGTALYIGARLGPGPRDGLMTGIVARTGWPVRWVRTSIEVAVVLTGWILGGTLGPATVAYALLVGPLVHPLLPRLTVPTGTDPGSRGDRAGHPPTVDAPAP